jgi:hypothetical protein
MPGPPHLLSLERPRFFSGRLLSVEDLQAEQEYHREKQRRHNRLFHGWGIVFGLDVSANFSEDGNRVQICISPGVALDCEGDEIIVDDCVTFPIGMPLQPSCSSTVAGPRQTMPPHSGSRSGTRNSRRNRSRCRTVTEPSMSISGPRRASSFRLCRHCRLRIDNPTQGLASGPMRDSTAQTPTMPGRCLLC